jgi:predicted AAA+ superfamily ATPase
MYRKAYEQLVLWNKSKARKPLLVYGARQVGKTYLIRNLFAEKNYKGNYIYIDFHEETEIAAAFEENSSLPFILSYIELRYQKKLSSKTLLIFDEAQDCLPIVSALKYFNQERPDIPVICTGSLVRVRLSQANRYKKEEAKFLYPVGKVSELTLYPLGFDEFLYNRNRYLYDYLLDAYKGKKNVQGDVHRLAMDAFYDYMLLGGMPEVVDTFLKTKDYLSAVARLREIYGNYLADMSLYQVSKESQLRAHDIYENIYRELNKENRDFKPGDLRKDLRTRSLFSPLKWLELSSIVYPSHCLKEKVTIPLSASDSKSYRLYLSDMGLFTYQSGGEATTFIDKKSQNALSGVYYENYVATALRSHGFGLFYWKGKQYAEMEFVFSSGGKIYPVDVKKSRGPIASLKEFGNHNTFEYAIKVSTNHYGFNEKQKILTLPFYDLPFYLDDMSQVSLLPKPNFDDVAFMKGLIEQERAEARTKDNGLTRSGVQKAKASKKKG